MEKIRAGVFATVLVLVLGASASAQVGANLGLVNPNLASEAELRTVPGLPAAAVTALIEGRPFFRMAAVHAVVSRHAQEDAFDTIYRGLWLPIDLNDVTDEEILLIPGVGDRMLHEFQEYRPFAALAVFHREIDKYVDDTELARLEQYVYVRIDLNTASDEAILSIPGIGSRMLREFKEYRPYAALPQFRREMGKYVDASEVARMERYVEIR
ncbi:MAG: hypothetical protein O2958_04720 [Gemmatimonadetes bacterium]|nr:hypothetical protein [Gemmatimonadota bacterium]MDA1102927.1 hypothetical protein [Gemmatimonadota bacterium]